MILLVIALFSGLSVNAASEGDFVNNDNGDGITVTITGYTGTEKLLTIPETLGGKPVTSIGDRAFQGNKLESVIIPTGVTTINYGAFESNPLKTVIFEGTPTTINPTAFDLANTKFQGWFTDKNYSNAWNKLVLGPMTIHAKYTYTVSFNTNGGTAVASQDIASYGKVKEPEVPTMTGHTFVARYKEELLTDRWDFANDEVTGDTTLYAKWKKNQSSGEGS